MPQPVRMDKARQLEALAGELHDLSFDFQEPSRSITRADALIARAESIASRIRTTVCGHPGTN